MCVLAAMVSAPADRASAAPASVAFADDVDGDAEILSIREDGSGRRQLTDNAAADEGPSWSPDGRHIAFASDRLGTFDIYVMRSDGANQTALTSGVDADLEPSWSPDGRHIAFSRTQPACSGPLVCTRIYVMRADGSELRPLADGASVTWSPDGRRLATGCFLGAFVGPLEVKDCGDRGVFLVNANASGRRRLTDGFAPSWSRDSSRIAFAAGDEGRAVQIHLITPSGTKRHAMTRYAEGILDRHPDWSPDGRRVAFYRKDTPTTFRRIYVVDVETGREVALTDGRDPSYARR